MKVALRRSLRHFIAVVVFLIIAALYCRPALQGKVLTQSDIIQWKGMSKSSLDYKDQFGHFPLWTNSMFSGMPAYQIAMDPDIKFYPGILHGLFTLWLPKPISFFFLACVCFYFLSQVLKTTTYIGIIGALSFAYATYNIGIIEAGHETKMLSIAYIPALIASLILVYERKYLVGATLAALCTMLLIAVNHPQIAYYTFLTSLILTIGYCVRWFRQRQFKHAFVSMGVVLIAGLIGIACNAVLILTSLDLSKTTIRGGSELPNQNSTKTGLTTDYALSYSMLKTEPFVMMVPDMYGGSGRSVLEKSEDSKTAEVLQAMPPEITNDLSGITQAYWGGIGPIAPNAPFYLGAIICFIGLVGFFILDNKHKWWILGTILLSFFMAWGAYFKDFNTFLLHSLPGYNKFRVPSMIICIPIFLFSVMAVLTLQKILSADNKDFLLKQYKKGLLLAAGSFVLLFLIYLGSDFNSQADKEVLAQASQTSQQIQNYITQVLNAVKDDRENLFLSSMYRSLVFIIMAAIALWLYIKVKIAPWIALSLIAVLSFIDLISVDLKYLKHRELPG